MMAESPALPCRDDVVENGDASPKSCLTFWRCAHHQPLVDYSPPAKPLQLRGPLSTRPLFGFIRPRRRIQRRIGGLEYYTCRMTALSCFLPTAYSFRMVKETKSGESRMFDPGSSQDRLRACPFFGIMVRVALW